MSKTTKKEGVPLLPLAEAGLNISFVDEEEETVDASSSESTPNIIVITFTEIDTENNTMSGTFAYDATDPNTGIVYEVRDGVFTEISFE